MAVDCFSRYACAVALKSKKPMEIREALSQIFKEYGIPLKVFTAKGTEFLNKHVKAFLKEVDVRIQTTLVKLSWLSASTVR